jgi:hypothetical protein
MILVECRQTSRMAVRVIERIDRSARRSAGEKSAARGAQHRGFEATGSQRARDLKSQEKDDRGTAGHGQQRRVRDAFLAEGRALAGRELLVGPAGGMAELMQQRRRLRKQERNQREGDQPMATGRTQDDSLRCNALKY